MSATRTLSSYDEARARHRWSVPDRYNIAADVCDRHPRQKLAMIHERFDGAVSTDKLGELQDDSNRFANVLSARGVGKGDRVAMLLPPTPETAAAFFGAWKVGAILLSMSVLYGRRGHPPSPGGLWGQGAGHRRRQRGSHRPGTGRWRCSLLDHRLLDPRRRPRFQLRRDRRR